MDDQERKMLKERIKVARMKLDKSREGLLLRGLDPNVLKPYYDFIAKKEKELEEED